MAEFLFKRNDYTHTDPEKDRRGVHKKTDFINWKPDGFSDFAHGNGPGSYLSDFVNDWEFYMADLNLTGQATSAGVL